MITEQLLPVARLATDAGPQSGEDTLERFREVRRWSEIICAPLTPEDYVVQSMADASPAKWHLAHTSWFFEQFLLKPNVPGYSSPHPQYEFLFNSYYNSVGDRHCRAKRGLISRPTVEDTYRYRRHVDDAMGELLSCCNDRKLSELRPLIELGFNHEQQHQELLVTDLKHMLSENPLLPVYRAWSRQSASANAIEPLRWRTFEGGLRQIGFEGSKFCFDNECPQHPEYIAPFSIANRLATNAEYMRFIDEGGYTRPEFWLSEGWATVQSRGWNAPMYWEKDGDAWTTFTLHGSVAVDPDEPVCHVSLFEADAYAHWSGARLSTEAEWEVASHSSSSPGALAESELFHPKAAESRDGSHPVQMIGDVWEWTRSQYTPYPGYRQAEGALGEYNGKFMCNQFVLRGGSCATPQSHIRSTYRNFFPSDVRWQFNGIRLAKDS